MKKTINRNDVSPYDLVMMRKIANGELKVTPSSCKFDPSKSTLFDPPKHTKSKLKPPEGYEFSDEHTGIYLIMAKTFKINDTTVHTNTCIIECEDDLRMLKNDSIKALKRI